MEPTVSTEVKTVCFSTVAFGRGWRWGGNAQPFGDFTSRPEVMNYNSKTDCKYYTNGCWVPNEDGNKSRISVVATNQGLDVSNVSHGGMHSTHKATSTGTRVRAQYSISRLMLFKLSGHVFTWIRSTQIARLSPSYKFNMGKIYNVIYLCIYI